MLEVRGDSITLPYTAAPRQIGELTAEIQRDGGFQASDGVGSLNGTLRGGELEITISSAVCENHWSLTRVD